MLFVLLKYYTVQKRQITFNLGFNAAYASHLKMKNFDFEKTGKNIARKTTILQKIGERMETY